MKKGKTHRLAKILPRKVRAWLYPEQRVVAISRTACLGTFTYQHLDNVFEFLPHYKNRVDYELNCLRAPGQRAEPEDVIPFLARQDLADIIKAEAQSLFSYKNVRCLFIDSFSELTDQLFRRADGSSFLAHFSDMNHTDEFENRYDCRGLLDLGNIETQYRDFFVNIIAAYGSIPIFFLHYSTQFDERELFKLRAQKIKECITSLASTEFDNLHSIALPDSLMERMPDNDFPYHYSVSNYQEFARLIKATPAYSQLV